MAEFIMKDLVRKEGLETQFHIEFAAVSGVQTGNPVYRRPNASWRSMGSAVPGKRPGILSTRTMAGTTS